MTRYRALSFGKPLAPWQATKELAEQAAVEADEASRDPQTGWIYLGAGVTIERDDGEPPELSPDMALWAEALAILRDRLFGAEDYIEAQIAKLVGDQQGQTRWRLIGKRIDQLREAAEKDDPSYRT